MMKHPQVAKEIVLSREEYVMSKFIASQLRTRPHHCYENAYPSFFDVPELFNPDGLFIEGWIVFVHEDIVVLMEHGFLMSRTGHLIDPTIVLEVDFDEPLSYFPGVIRKREELEKLENEFFPHVRFEEYGDDGMAHPAYHAAYEAALQKANSLATGGKTLKEVRARELTQAEILAEAEPTVTIKLLPFPNEQRDGY